MGKKLGRTPLPRERGSAVSRVDLALEDGQIQPELLDIAYGVLAKRTAGRDQAARQRDGGRRLPRAKPLVKRPDVKRQLVCCFAEGTPFTAA